jgi:pre-mRNA-processing factor SLU7
MTHNAKDCLERPRKLGARWTGRDIAPDEIIHDNSVENWDSKRDRWDGYDPASHKRVIEEHEALEEARRKLREEQIDSTTDLKEVQKMAKTGKKKRKDDEDFGSSDESEDEDDLKYADAADVVGQKLDAKTRVTVRNLRIREDTAKYLVNLDPERQALVPF